jgi:hypothetical protein
MNAGPDAGHWLGEQKSTMRMPMQGTDKGILRGPCISSESVCDWSSCAIREFAAVLDQSHSSEQPGQLENDMRQGSGRRAGLHIAGVCECAEFPFGRVPVGLGMIVQSRLAGWAAWEAKR